MADQRFIIEMGMGNDLHGMDYQKAAKRAIEDAFRHSTLPIFGTTGIDSDEMRVQVTVGVQEPDMLDCEALAGMLPRGRATVAAVRGGQNVTNPETGETIVIATAAIEAFLPFQGGALDGGGPLAQQTDNPGFQVIFPRYTGGREHHSR